MAPQHTRTGVEIAVENPSRGETYGFRYIDYGHDDGERMPRGHPRVCAASRSTATRNTYAG